MSAAEIGPLLEVGAAVICVLACMGIGLELVRIWMDRKNLKGDQE